MANCRNARPTLHDGFTLVELLVYLAFSVIILSLAGGMLISTLNAEKSVTARSEATASGQVIAQSVLAGVRNAADLSLTENDAGSDQMLVVVPSGGAGVAVDSCDAWYYTEANGGRLYFKRAAVITTPTPGEASDGWILLADGVSPTGEDGIFTSSKSTTGTEIVGLAFTVAQADGGAPFLIETTASNRKASSGITLCFEATS